MTNFPPKFVPKIWLIIIPNCFRRQLVLHCVPSVATILQHIIAAIPGKFDESVTTEQEAIL